jgi:CBS domain-containing protein
VLIFAFQAENLTSRFSHVVLIAIPILIQVYFNSSLAYGLMKLLRVPHSVAAPDALIGASNFFELAVATAIALYGPGSGAALATVVGVLVEVPVMLSVVAACNRTRHWFPEPGAASASQAADKPFRGVQVQFDEPVTPRRIYIRVCVSPAETHRHRTLLVVEQRRLLGIISTFDLVGLVSDGRLVEDGA